MRIVKRKPIKTCNCLTKREFILKHNLIGNEFIVIYDENKMDEIVVFKDTYDWVTYTLAKHLNTTQELVDKHMRFFRVDIDLDLLSSPNLPLIYDLLLYKDKDILHFDCV